LKPSLMRLLRPADDVELEPAWRRAAGVGRCGPGEDGHFELVRNALEATLQRSNRKATLRAVPAPGASRAEKKNLSWVSLAVSDDGPGIPEHANRAHLLSHFSPPRSASTTPGSVSPWR